MNKYNKKKPQLANISINQELTRINGNLVYYARFLVLDKKLKSTWVVDDKIYIIDTKNDKRIIRNNDDFCEMVNEHGIEPQLNGPNKQMKPQMTIENAKQQRMVVPLNDPDVLSYTEVGDNILEANVRYHCPVSGIINTKKTPNKVSSRKIWDYDHADLTDYKNDVSEVNWDNISNDNDVNVAVTNITETILRIAAKHIPCFCQSLISRPAMANWSYKESNSAPKKTS
ncbi:unnamed protein product [Mytilus coruscus]|uniref:Uncharacterized protein n=1 Tax=Mytilus coruscus TaxID=42192 RepID=A0A6J8ECG3_MYTCO|nr:unnamed protein product [Mytilus coruscus]